MRFIQKILRKLLLIIFTLLTRLICRIHDDALELIPAEGPLILMVNHINILEIPIFFTALQPRHLIAFSAAKRWKVWWSRWLLNLADAIPLKIGETNIQALRKGITVLKENKILLIAPEGTRSGHGRLQQGYPGVVVVAMRSGAPILPLGFYGHENYKSNLLQLKRTDFTFTVGEPFYLDPKVAKVTRSVRQGMLEEMMYQLAAILPPEYRGVYGDLENASENYLVFKPPGGFKSPAG
jgi:1-acyl-sn-glycerol-3-phosphate acyltransferase